MKNVYLFVYGTLRRDSDGAMSRWLARQADFVATGTCQGRLYRIDFYPGVVASGSPSDRVHGEVHRLRDPERSLARLDQYEACGPGFEEPTEYIRQLQPVRLQSARTLTAWIYLYNLPVHERDRIPSGDFSREPDG